jgi:hypothetical protein
VKPLSYRVEDQNLEEIKEEHAEEDIGTPG